MKPLPFLRDRRRRRIGRQVIDAAREILAEGLVVSTAGNVSARIGVDQFLITPTRRPYGTIGRRDLVVLGIAGGPVLGTSPSIEWPLHAAIYRARREIEAIVHTHSPAATAWSFTGRNLNLSTEDSGYFRLGPVGCAPRARAGSQELAETAAKTLGDGRAALLEGHGAVAVGHGLDDALEAAIVVERQAQIALLVCRSGEPASSNNAPPNLSLQPSTRGKHDPKP